MGSKNTKIGIVGAGFQGKAIAIWFAKRDFFTILYDFKTDQLRNVEIELKQGKEKNRPFKKFLKLTNCMDELKECDLIIENIPEKLSLKQRVFKQIEKISKKNVILASNSSTFIPTLISNPLKARHKFVNIHFLGIAWAQPILELIPGKHTTKATIQRVKTILMKAKLIPIETGECQGFIYNRIKLIEISNLFKALELKLVSLQQVLKYIVIPRQSTPLTHIDLVGLDVAELTIKSLNEHYGDRYYVPNILAAKVKNNELGKKTGKGLLEHSGGVSLEQMQKIGSLKFHSPLQKVYINELQINNSNLIVQMIRRKKQVFLGKKNARYLTLLKKLDEKLFKKVVDNCAIVEESDIPDDFDVVMDFPSPCHFESIIQRINNLQEKFGALNSYIINLPIHKVEEIARNTKFPSTVFGMHIQKTYLRNTELIKHKFIELKRYNQIKEFIKELTGGCIEVSDGEARPLIFLLLSKMFEAIRILEEKVCTIGDIENILIRDLVFKDIDYFGLDNLLFIAYFLQPIFGEPFNPPKLLTEKIKKGHYGVMSGQGFYHYY